MTPLETAGKQTGLMADPRWQLVERVVSSATFQKAHRLRDLLYHLAERSICEHASELTEQRIGQVIFGKPADYSPSENSSVRVHARQLRLKLHEYFDVEGRNDSLINEIPKGSYAPIFRSVTPIPPAPIPPAVSDEHRKTSKSVVLPWLLAAALSGLCLYLWVRPNPPAPVAAPWPLSEVFHGGSRTQIVVADVNYGMLRVMTQKPGSLEDYLRPGFAWRGDRRCRDVSRGRREPSAFEASTWNSRRNVEARLF